METAAEIGGFCLQLHIGRATQAGGGGTDVDSLACHPAGVWDIDTTFGGRDTLPCSNPLRQGQ